jgi:hypothetical protein
MMRPQTVKKLPVIGRGRRKRLPHGGAGAFACVRRFFHNFPFHFCAVVVIVSLAAQEKTAPDKGMARFTSNTNLVVVDVYARDKSGKPVLNLKKEDFTILEDGKAQTISVFELQRLDGEVLPPMAGQP